MSKKNTPPSTDALVKTVRAFLQPGMTLKQENVDVTWMVVGRGTKNALIRWTWPDGTTGTENIPYEMILSEGWVDTSQLQLHD